MIQVFFNLPVVLILLAGGALLGGAVAPGQEKRRWAAWAGVAAGVLLALAIGWWQGWLDESVAVRGYGTMILAGFLLGVWMARRRAHLLGLSPDFIMDVGLAGSIGGVLGARFFHVLQNWNYYAQAGVAEMFRVWHGGLVFYGAFAAAAAITWVMCRRVKMPVLPFLDLSIPGFVGGLALGRLGCFTRGCCFGKTCDLPWAVRFPEGSDAFQSYVGFTPPFAADATPPIHPTQLYAFAGAALIAGFLYAYWPRRRFDGEVFGYMLIMAGATRFLEELLRADVPAAFPSVSNWMTIAQWIGLGLIASGVVLLAVMSRRGKLYVPPEKSVPAPVPA
ncbi:MAG: prolipoprotein diacylglyceryl transferase [Planctomycetota bacterium]|nr:prolipoprotein diacylglyceryl transferase [Planctomycetota bacterium]